MTTEAAPPDEIDAGAIETRLRSSARSMIGTLVLSAWMYLTFLTLVELPHLIIVNAQGNADPSPWAILRLIARPTIDAWQDSDEDGALISSDGMSVASAVAVAVVAGLGTATRRAHEVSAAAQPHESAEQAKLIAIERSMHVQNAIAMAVMGGLCVAIASRIVHGASGQTLLLPTALLVWLIAEAAAPQDASFARPAREALRRRSIRRVLERQDSVLRRWDLSAATTSAIVFCSLNALAMILPGLALRSASANLSKWLVLAIASGIMLGAMAFASHFALVSHRRWAGWFLTIATALFVALAVWVAPVTPTTSGVQFVLHGLWSLSWIVVALGLLGWPQRCPVAALSTIAAWISCHLNPEGRVRLFVISTCASSQARRPGSAVIATVDGVARAWRYDEEGPFIRARAGQRVDLQVQPRSRMRFETGTTNESVQLVDARHQFRLVCSGCPRAHQ